MLHLQLQTYKRSLAAVDVCPYGDRETNICLASLSSMVIDHSSRQEYCSNDNYDNCPIFLARSLRRR
jgi:hypothetical protein